MNTSEKIRGIWDESRNKDRIQRDLYSYLHLMNVSQEEREKLVWDVVDRVLQRVKKGIDGIDGRDGKDGVDGVDGRTPTKEELLRLIKPLIPVVKDGKTPTREELYSLIIPLIPLVKDGQDGKTPGKAELEEIIKPIVSQVIAETKPTEAEKPTYDEIKGIVEPIIRQLMTEARKGWFGGGGGGDMVRAGSGVTITTNNIGAKVISASGGGTVETPSGTVDGSNVTFTVTVTPKWIVADGITYYENAGYSISGTTVTMVSPPVQYIRAIS